MPKTYNRKESMERFFITFPSMPWVSDSSASTAMQVACNIVSKTQLGGHCLSTRDALTEAALTLGMQKSQVVLRAQRAIIAQNEFWTAHENRADRSKAILSRRYRSLSETCLEIAKALLLFPKSSTDLQWRTLTVTAILCRTDLAESPLLNKLVYTELNLGSHAALTVDHNFLTYLSLFVKGHQGSVYKNLAKRVHAMVDDGLFPVTTSLVDQHGVMT